MEKMVFREKWKTGHALNNCQKLPYFIKLS